MNEVAESRNVVWGEGAATLGSEIVVGPADGGGEMNWNC